jgi:hypothetical protein
MPAGRVSSPNARQPEFARSSSKRITIDLKFLYRTAFNGIFALIWFLPQN